MRRFVAAVLLSLVAALSSGCATSNEGDVSTIPWNRPQSWEGSGALGGFTPPGGPGH